MGFFFTYIKDHFLRMSSHDVTILPPWSVKNFQRLRDFAQGPVAVDVVPRHGRIPGPDRRRRRRRRARLRASSNFPGQPFARSLPRRPPSADSMAGSTSSAGGLQNRF